jgi:3-hydroxyacyl-CoA dehydrogenase
VFKKILTIGAGNMGGQVSFYHAMTGTAVIQYDISQDSLDDCKKQHQLYAKAYQAARPGVTDQDIEAGQSRISYSTNLQQAARGVDLVIESAPENPEVKQTLYRELNEYCSSHTIFCTNTSTLLPSQLAESTGRPERFLAFHYAMEIWESPMVEVMRHPSTSDESFKAMLEFAEVSQLVPIKMEKEQPGYIINSLLVPWLTSALSLVVNGISSYQDVDKTWMICGQGMRMGPIGILDQLGFEVCRNVHLLMAANEPDNPQYHKNIEYVENNFLSKGFMGARSGQGFYSYPNPEYLAEDFLK